MTRHDWKTSRQRPWLQCSSTRSFPSSSFENQRCFPLLSLYHQHSIIYHERHDIPSRATSFWVWDQQLWGEYMGSSGYGASNTLGRGCAQVKSTRRQKTQIYEKPIQRRPPPVPSPSEIRPPASEFEAGFQPTKSYKNITSYQDNIKLTWNVDTP